jgi:hypothetical protein
MNKIIPAQPGWNLVFYIDPQIDPDIWGSEEERLVRLPVVAWEVQWPPDISDGDAGAFPILAVDHYFDEFQTALQGPDGRFMMTSECDGALENEEQCLAEFRKRANPKHETSLSRARWLKVKARGYREEVAP